MRVELVFGLNRLTEIVRTPFLHLYVFLGTMVAFGVFGAMVGSREDLLEAMALRDSLTGLFNARYLQMRLGEELAAAKRHRSPVSFVLFDIDHFKRVNDEHGHPVGDRMLRLIGRSILSKLRVGETVARVGGEEFAMLLPHTSAKNAAIGAERIRQAIGQTTLETDSGQTFPLLCPRAWPAQRTLPPTARKPSIVWPTRLYTRPRSRAATGQSSQDRGHPIPNPDKPGLNIFD